MREREGGERELYFILSTPSFASSTSWAAHSQDFGEFDFIALLLIFSSRNHPLEFAAC